MTSLTVDPTTPLAASAHVPSTGLSDKEVLDISETPDSRGQTSASYERKLGDIETSYYLQSRATGVNDMFASLA